MKKEEFVYLVALIPFIMLAGCGGVESFAPNARAGDTIAIGAGWTETFEREDLTITITGSDDIPVILSPGDPSIRAVINLYPDPLSYILVGTRVGLNNNYRYGSTYGSVVNGSHTNYNPDWYQTSIYIDLPSSLPVGNASIHVQSTSGESYGPVAINIIPGVGEPTKFKAESLSYGLSEVQLRSLERAPFNKINFSGGAELPSSLEVMLTHDPDASVGGMGIPFVVNPRGEMKNIIWRTDGSNMKILILPSGQGTENDPYLSNYGLKYFEFYVSGTITGLSIAEVKAFDSIGNIIPGVTATIN